MLSLILFDLFGIVTNKKLYDKLVCLDEHFHEDLFAITEQILDLKKRNEQMAIDLSALIEQVARNAEVDAAALTLIAGLKAQIDQLVEDLADQPEIAAKIIELAEALDASSDALAAAVITPPVVVEEPVVEEPVVVEEPIVE